MSHARDTNQKKTPARSPNILMISPDAGSRNTGLWPGATANKSAHASPRAAMVNPACVIALNGMELAQMVFSEGYP